MNCLPKFDLYFLWDFGVHPICWTRNRSQARKVLLRHPDWRKRPPGFRFIQEKWRYPNKRYHKPLIASYDSIQSIDPWFINSWFITVNDWFLKYDKQRCAYWWHVVVIGKVYIPSQWRHNECDGVSNHQPHHRLLNCLFSCRSKKTSKLHITGLCAGNSPVTGEFPAQMASNAENASISWRHRVIVIMVISIIRLYQLIS